MGTLDGDVGGLRTAVADAEDSVSGVTGALHGPVAAAFSTFASTRRDAPAELVVMADNAVGAAIGAVAALAVGNEEMADQQRLGRVHATGSWTYQGYTSGVDPW